MEVDMWRLETGKALRLVQWEVFPETTLGGNECRKCATILPSPMA